MSDFLTTIGAMKRVALAASIVALAQAAAAAEIVVMSVGAVKSPFVAAASAWEKASGNTVSATFNPAGDVRRKLAAGGDADIVILPREDFADLERDARVAADSRRNLGGVSMAAAVRKGAPVPDISTPEALKQTLLQAKSVTYMDPERGTSGKHFDETVLRRLGIRDEVRAKTTLGEGGYIAEKVARGDVEIAFHNLTEILPVEGVTLVGLIPKELQRATVYSGAVMKTSASPAQAQALLDYLASPEGRKAFLDRGFTAP
jgi:molybdate transport system substrate-binding protein